MVFLHGVDGMQIIGSDMSAGKPRIPIKYVDDVGVEDVRTAKIERYRCPMWVSQKLGELSQRKI